MLNACLCCPIHNHHSGLCRLYLVSYLGKVLPVAIMATLVVYCLRSTTFTSAGGFLPQFIAVAVTAALHLWKQNTLISVFAGTVIYMCLVQFVFV